MPPRSVYAKHHLAAPFPAVLRTSPVPGRRQVRLRSIRLRAGWASPGRPCCRVEHLVFGEAGDVAATPSWSSYGRRVSCSSGLRRSVLLLALAHHRGLVDVVTKSRTTQAAALLPEGALHLARHRCQAIIASSACERLPGRTVHIGQACRCCIKTTPPGLYTAVALASSSAAHRARRSCRQPRLPWPFPGLPLRPPRYSLPQIRGAE